MSPERTGRYEVLVVGCGNIAGGFDADRPADAPPLTHAGAFHHHGGFRLAACVDPDDARRTAFMRRWDVPDGAVSLAALGAGTGRFDVASICSPTAHHAANLDAVLELHPRLIFCEKPVTTSVEATASWVARCAEASVALAVNHTRRWAPDIVRLRDELQAGAWGTLRSVVGHYNKGVLNNGSHLIDLLHLLVGPLELVATGAPVWDFWDDDPTVPALLRTAAGMPVYLNAAHAADFALFELQLLTSTAVLTMEDGGLHWRVRRAVESPRFKGYRALDCGDRFAGEYPAAMQCAVANLHDALSSAAPLASTGATALQAQRVCQRIREAALVAPPDRQTDYSTIALSIQGTLR